MAGVDRAVEGCAGIVMDKVFVPLITMFSALVQLFTKNTLGTSSGRPPSYSLISAHPGGIQVASMKGNSAWAWGALYGVVDSFPRLRQVHTAH